MLTSVIHNSSAGWNRFLNPYEHLLPVRLFCDPNVLNASKDILRTRLRKLTENDANTSN